MDFNQFILDERYLSAIGWTLAHSVWQIALMSTLLWAVLKVMPKATAQLRYVFGLGALGLIWFMTGWTFVSQLGSISASQQEGVLASVQLSSVSPGLPYVAKEAATLVGQPTAGVYWVQKIDSLLPYIVHLWILGAIFYSGRLAGSLYDLQKLHRKHHEAVSQKLLKKVDSLSSAMGLYQKVQVFRSTLVRTPVTYGFIKPVI